MIWTISDAVANLSQGNASASLAFKLLHGTVALLFVFAVDAFGDPVTAPCLRDAPFLYWAQVFIVPAAFGTIIFILVTLTVGATVALPRFRDTSSYND